MPHFAHALVVANGGGQDRAQHRSAIDDVAVEEEVRVGDLALLALRSGVEAERMNRLREVVSGAHNFVRARGGLSGEKIGRGR